MAVRTLRTALVIEPSPFRFQGIRRALHAAGIERVLQAGGGADAVSRIGEELVDVVLLPWETEDLAGEELVRALRERSAERRTALVLLDDGLPQETVVQAVKAGVVGRIGVLPHTETLRTLLATIAGEA